MEDKNRPKSLQEERFSEDSILEIIVTVFVVAIVTFFFIKIVFL
jgi:hypothetical protein